MCALLRMSFPTSLRVCTELIAAVGAHISIGQTKRTIAERIKEYITVVQNHQINKSAIAEHIVDTETNHWIELHEPKILSTDRYYYPRIVREAIEIEKHKNFYREEGYKLSSEWNPVIDKFKNRGLSHSVKILSV